MRRMRFFLLLLSACAAPDRRVSSETLDLWRTALRGPAEFTSPEVSVAEFDRAVVSWNATGSVRIEFRIRGGEWHLMGEWGPDPRSAKTDSVDVDTFVAKESATAFQFRLTLAEGAEVTLVAVTHWKEGERNPLGARPSAAWGRILQVPERSQLVEDERIRGEICSPTSVSMALEFHGFKFTTREVADGVFDHGAKIYGNWPFNAAHAHVASKGKLEAYVLHGRGIEDIEAEIAAGRPVVLSHRWKKGDLTGAPIESSNGHLILVIGFTMDGDVVVNDPAAKPGTIRRVYKRAELYTTWLERASGILYILRPAP